MAENLSVIVGEPMKKKVKKDDEPSTSFVSYSDFSNQCSL